MPRKVSKSKAYDFGEAFGALTQKVEDGFSGINRRLDTLNGKVAEHERKFVTIDTKQAFQDGRRKSEKAFWMILGAILSLIIAGLTFLAQAGFITAPPVK